MALEQKKHTKRAAAKHAAVHTYGIAKDLLSLAGEGAVAIAHVATALLDRTSEERRGGRSDSDIVSETIEHVKISSARMRELRSRIIAKGIKLKKGASFEQMVDSVAQKAGELEMPIDRPATLEDLDGLVKRMPQVERVKDR